jgi:uracil-DNA glycosylase family 4
VHREPSQREEMTDSSADVSAGAQPRNEIAAALAVEALRHLEWLRSAGVREVPPSLERSAPPSGFPAAARPEVAEEPAIGARQERDARPHDAGAQDERPGADAERPPTHAAEGPSKFAGAKGCGSPALLAVREELGECTRCKLAGGRHHLVFGVGDPRAELVFVGEGPGEDEDLQGEPFVGRAGQLLTKMIEAMGYARSDVYIANVVKCRPPGNRNPEPDEIEACERFLRAQLAAIRPRVVVALGKFAAQTLLRDGTAISRLRGRWFTYEGVKLMPTFHPAYLLRSPEEKKKAWEDLQLVMKELGKSPPRR